MRIRSVLLGLVASLGAILALAPSHPADAQAQFTLNFGTVAPDGTPWATQLADIKRRIEGESGQRIKVKLFLGGSLGSEIEMIQDVGRGERLQGGGFSTGAMGEALDMPLLEMVELPYLFRSETQADAVLDEVLYQPTVSQLAAKKITFYAWSENGWRSMATKGGPARTPEELRAYKMRAQESSVHKNMYEALGVQAVSKPTSEVLPALNTGIVTGFDNTPLFSLAAGWIDPVTHYTLTRHIYQPAAVVYSKTFIDGLPADLQAIVLKDPTGEARKGRAAVRALEDSLLDTMRSMGKQVVELTPDQHKAYREAVRSKVHAAFLAAHPELQGQYAAIKQKLQAVQ